MAADTYNSILGLINQGTGNNNNNWGSIFESAFAVPIERAFAGVNTITATSGTMDLSTTVPPAGLRLDIDYIQKATGALTGDLTIQVPNVSKTWRFWNATSNAFNMYVKVPSGVARANASTPGGLVQIPQGCVIDVTCDGGGLLIRSDDREIGTLSMSGKAAAGPGEIALNGASLLKASFPDLYGKISTTWGTVDGTHFTVPNFTDTNRFLRAGGGSGPAVGTYQSNQNLAHSHSVTGTPGLGTLNTDTQGSHTHSGSDVGHQHLVNIGNSGTVASSNVPTGTAGNPQYVNTGSVNTTTGFASITIGSAGSHTHNVVGTPSLGTLGTASSGGAEARPEAAAVLICIRY